MSAVAAARLGDEVAHGFGMLAMVAGAVVGAVIGVAIVGAAVATGGVAVAIIAGSVAAGGLSLGQLVKGLTKKFKLSEPASGVLMLGSGNVRFNSRAAMRANLDIAACSGLPFNHPGQPAVPIAQGSGTVRINGMPAARLNDKLMCGAHIKSGSPNIFIGGPTAQVRSIYDTEEWAEYSLTALGIFAIGVGGGAAAAAGRLAMFLGITGGVMLGFEGIGMLGDCWGPGGRDILQGAAGLLLLGLGPKLARMGRANTLKEPVKEPIANLGRDLPVSAPKAPVVKAKASINEHEFHDVNQTARERPDASKLTAISDKVTTKEIKTGKQLPNGNMATAHAEIGAMQQAIDAGVTKGANMTLEVSGKVLCDFCRSDVVSMAKEAKLNSLKIFEEVSGKTLYWEPGMKKLGTVE